MLISIDPSSPAPLYKQIHDQIVAGIATGELEPGSSLPSVRALASDLGINLHTVNKAYAVLRDEGYVRMRGRAGAVIAHPNDADRAGKNSLAIKQTEDELFKLALSYRACGGTRGEFLECAAAQAARAFGIIPDGESTDAEARNKDGEANRPSESSSTQHDSLTRLAERITPAKKGCRA